MLTISRTINVSFPRSGHRFLRNICQSYFGKDLRFVTSNNVDFSSEEANYIKEHDFGLLNSTKGIPICSGTQYLIQYRHPLESLVSYFEFNVKHGIITDDRDSWVTFLPRHIDYWKAFALKWYIANEKKNDRNLHIVRYSDLYIHTFTISKRVIEFLTKEQLHVDEQRLQAAVNKYKKGFFRYAEDQNNNANLVVTARNIRNFKYFGRDFYELEEELKSSFLDPLGIKTILLSERK